MPDLGVGVLQRDKPVLIQALQTKLAVKGLSVGIIGGFARPGKI
jgi:hypothetical protein